MHNAEVPMNREEEVSPISTPPNGVDQADSSVLDVKAWPEAGKEDNGGAGAQRNVPYGALAKERGRRRDLQRALEEALHDRDRLRERLEALHQAPAMERKVEASSADTPATAEPEHSALPDRAENAGSSEVDGAFRTQVLRSVRSFSGEHPDFVDAYRHARLARMQELTDLGYGPEEAQAITFDNEREAINAAFASGRNPAQVIYEYAIRCGYRPAGGPATPIPAVAQRPSAKSVEGATMTEAEKIALAARGQAASKSLSSAGGGSTGTLTLEALAGMSDEEFAEATEGDRWRRLLNG